MPPHPPPSGRHTLHRPGSQRRRSTAPVTRRPFPAFIAYSDVTAAREAIARLSKTIDHRQRELLPMLWRFSQLDQPRWREMALREAGRAATIVIAMPPKGTLSTGTDAWLTALTVQQRGATISALLLVGDECWTISLQQTLPKPIALAETLRRSPSASVSSQRPTACAA